MSTTVYQHSIVSLATDATGAGALDDPDARVIVDNPVCGDRVTMDIGMAGDTIESLAHKIRGCVLCQAAASLVGARAPGCSRSEIDAVRDVLAAMLDGTGEAPAGRWRDLAVFAPVAAHRHRHHCVLLPFEALHRALDAVRTTK